MVRSRASTFASIALSSLRFAVSSRLFDLALARAGSATAALEGLVAGGSSGASSSIWISARKGAASSWREMHSVDIATRRSMRSCFGSFIMAATAALVAADIWARSSGRGTGENHVTTWS